MELLASSGGWDTARWGRGVDLELPAGRAHITLHFWCAERGLRTPGGFWRSAVSQSVHAP